MTTVINRRLEEFLPEHLRDLEDPQTAIPQIAQDSNLTNQIEQIVRVIPTRHTLYESDSRNLEMVEDYFLHKPPMVKKSDSLNKGTGWGSGEAKTINFVFQTVKPTREEIENRVKLIVDILSSEDR